MENSEVGNLILITILPSPASRSGRGGCLCSTILRVNSVLVYHTIISDFVHFISSYHQVLLIPEELQVLLSYRPGLVMPTSPAHQSDKNVHYLLIVLIKAVLYLSFMFSSPATPAPRWRLRMRLTASSRWSSPRRRRRRMRGPTLKVSRTRSTP